MIVPLTCLDNNINIPTLKNLCLLTYFKFQHMIQYYPFCKIMSLLNVYNFSFQFFKILILIFRLLDYSSLYDSQNPLPRLLSLRYIIIWKNAGIQFHNEVLTLFTSVVQTGSKTSDCYSFTLFYVYRENCFITAPLFECRIHNLIILRITSRQKLVKANVDILTF